MVRTLNVLAAVAALVAGPALAHEKGDRAMGVVESVTAGRIVITASDGHAVEFRVSPDTRFFVGEKAVGAQDVRTGQRAVVHGKRIGETLTAVRVKLAPP
jgi:hypothetical protein